MARTTHRRIVLQSPSDDEEGTESEQRAQPVVQRSEQIPVNKASASTSGARSASRSGSRHNGGTKPISRQSKADDVMELDGDEPDVAELPPEPEREPKPSALTRPSSRVSNGVVASSHKQKVVTSGTEHDVSELLSPPRKRARSETEWGALVQQLTSERDDYWRNFQELARLRETEAEKALDAYRTQAEEHARHQQERIEMLSNLMLRIEELAVPGRTAPITLLTREETDARLQEHQARQQGVKAEITELKERLRIAESSLKDKDKDIETLKKHHQQEIAMRQRDYDAEVANSKRLMEERNMARNELATLTNGTMSRPRGGGGTAREPEKRTLLGPTKEQSTICLYEDLSQLMVRNVNTTRGEYGIQTEFKCYMTKPGTHETLVFNLDVVPEPTEDDPKLEMLRYTPQDLDKLSEEFKRSLEFLTDTFKCPKEQSPQFLHQVQLHMGFNFSADAEETDEEDDEIEYLGSNEPN